MTWAQRIKAIRTRLGLTIDGFASLLGLSYQTIYGWERGKIPDAQCPFLLVDMLEKSPEDGERLLSQRFVAFGEETFGERVRRIRKRMGMPVVKFADLLKVSPGSVVRWESGAGGADQCIAVLVDLLDSHLEDAAPLLWPDLAWRSIEETGPEWPPERIWLLLEATGLSPDDLAAFLRVDAHTVRQWLESTRKPGPCPSLLLWLIETHGPRVYFLMKDVPDEDWPAQKVHALRKSLEFTLEEMAKILGVTLGNYAEMEKGGAKRACWGLVFSLLETRREEMMALLTDLPRLA